MGMGQFVCCLLQATPFHICAGPMEVYKTSEKPNPHVILSRIACKCVVSSGDAGRAGRGSRRGPAEAHLQVQVGVPDKFAAAV